MRDTILTDAHREVRDSFVQYEVEVVTKGKTLLLIIWVYAYLWGGEWWDLIQIYAKTCHWKLIGSLRLIVAMTREIRAKNKAQTLSQWYILLNAPKIIPSANLLSVDRFSWSKPSSALFVSHPLSSPSLSWAAFWIIPLYHFGRRINLHHQDFLLLRLAYREYRHFHHTHFRG